MNKTLKISFSLKNTYRVNSILFGIKQIPLIKKLLPDMLYQVRGLKVFANVLSVLWEIISAFLGKFLYFLIMLVGAGMLYNTEEGGRLFLHMLLFLTIIGAYANTYMFNPSKDKYYALILMRMNSKQYTLINYFYAIIKLLVGFTVFGILFGRAVELPFWLCLLIPFFVTGTKLTVAAYDLWRYERTGVANNENKLSNMLWIIMGLLLVAAYGLPAFHIMLPKMVCVLVMVLSVLTGLLSLHKIVTFQYYREVYHEILIQGINMVDDAKKEAIAQNHKLISADMSINSKRKGFEYLNELFIKRHQKILWKSAKRIAMVCLAVVLGLLLVFYLEPTVQEKANSLLMTFLPYFVFIMYAINRGTGFTRVLFVNCDHSLLTYSFYKQPQFILQLFQIRLREIIKINLLPAAVIGFGLAVLLYASGGTDNPLNYVVLVVSILCMSIFFSVHYLTIYYLLQPYNAGTEVKSGTYQLIMSGTYMACYFLMQLKMSTLTFGFMTIVFCVLYCIVASILVYKFAPKTFRIRA